MADNTFECKCKYCGASVRYSMYENITSQVFCPYCGNAIDADEVLRRTIMLKQLQYEQEDRLLRYEREEEERKRQYESKEREKQRRYDARERRWEARQNKSEDEVSSFTMLIVLVAFLMMLLGFIIPYVS